MTWDFADNWWVQGRSDDQRELLDAESVADLPEEYLHEPEGAVIRARLIGEVARSLDAGMIDAKIAYLTSDAPAAGSSDGTASPFVQSFRVREQLPNDPKALGKALRERGIGTLEIKKRGVDVDPATLRRRLKPAGPNSATLLLTPTPDGVRALVVRRL